jgi:hypothetical protein
MRRIAAMVAVSSFVILMTGPVFARTETVTGQVISLSCYFQNKANVGAAGMICAIATVKWEGNPVGLLTADGKVYQLAGGLVADNNAKAILVLGQTVTVTGETSERIGITMIAAEDAKVVK